MKLPYIFRNNVGYVCGENDNCHKFYETKRATCLGKYQFAPTLNNAGYVCGGNDNCHNHPKQRVLRAWENDIYETIPDIQKRTLHWELK